NATQLVGELFMMLTDTSLTHVPYRGGAPAVTDLLAGQVQVYFDGISGSLEHVRTGRLRGFAVTNATGAAGVPGPGPRRVHTGVRRDRLVWCGRTQGYSRRDHRPA